ncbi:hypothetical protein [Corynebacterium pilosum]|uniref:SCP domain-containing protein n=1 Tax=Corynebacterium pilosum TaxID=35756 RepID=A0A376CN18_9CORY|nr:hypothetical protein [Corynebacterium pilosum]STC69891.1 Uncharacterised protein [Corynebacterium pilosum]
MPRIRRTLLAAATAVAVALSPMNVASAQPAQKEPALGTGVLLNITMDQTIGVTATFNPADSRNVGIPALKRLRGEMWDLNPPFVDDWNGWNGTLRDAARSQGLTTKEAYVNAVYSDPAMVPIAVQRAVEESARGSELNHDRPYNQSCLAHSPAASCKKSTTATFNGEKMRGENLAWGSHSYALTEIIHQGWGHGEYQRLLASNGRWASGNGHLWVLLSPANYGFGFSHVTTQGGAYPVAAATAISDRKQSRPDRSLDQRITRTMYRPAAMHETPTGLERITLREGTALPIQHTAELWGGTSHEWIAPRGQPRH